MAHRNNNDALIFANGPYQLLVGLACARRHIENLNHVYVLLYDMKWQNDLQKTCQDFSQILGLKLINFPYEFRKSDISNKKPHRFRSIINHLSFFLFGIINSIPNFFIPKPYGSPERAIILSSLNKKIYIYDDGFGMYIDPIINQNKFDRQLYTIIDRYFLKQKANMLICPRKPDLLDYSSFHGIRLSSYDYSNQLWEYFQTLARHFSPLLRKDLGYEVDEKIIILIALPRLAFTDQQKISKEIFKLIKAVAKSYPNVLFLLKPHPRDLRDDLQILSKGLINVQYSAFLPESTIPYPIEVISLILDAPIILSGYSTVGINGDLFPKTRVMVFDFLSFNISHYNNYARGIMIKAGGYAGGSVQNAINQIKLTLTGTN